MEKHRLKNTSLAFFMNYLSSLETWDRFGMFSREIHIYNELAKEFKHIYIFTYGDHRDMQYADRIAPNITVIPKTLPVPDIIYELLLPFVHFATIRTCGVLKTNQNSGTIAPSIARLLLRHTRFVMRSGYIGSEFARRNSLPLYAKAYFWLAENISYRVCDRACIPASDAPTLLTKYPFLADKIIALNNAIDTERFAPQDRAKKYDIIYLARMDTTQKNHAGLLTAVRGLGLSVLFIGRGPQEDALREQARKDETHLEILDKVPNEDIPSYYNAARLCVFPSTFEGNPKALLEAMSCAVPIVAFDVPGISSLITHDVSGLLSTVDPGAMRTNIQALLADPARATRLGTVARDTILEHFAFTSILQTERNLYNSLLTK